MAKTDRNIAQAATELAVFGAILIFILGTILRSAAGNSYQQNQNLKVMRMAMLASWNGSQATNLSRNSASILFIEDRLSPDVNKYGSLERTPYIANGSGTFSYNLLYPMDASEVGPNLPIMDVYINGQHFPFTTAAYKTKVPVTRPETCPYPAGSCPQNQCLRNQREWVGGIVKATQFETVAPITLTATTLQRTAQEQANATAIFNYLSTTEAAIISVTGSGISAQGTISPVFTTLSPLFKSWYQGQFPGPDQGAQITQIQTILQQDKAQYKLFYTLVPNGTSQFTLTPPTCNSHPCKDKELSSDLVLGGVTNGPTAGNPIGGDLMYDLQRTGATNAQIESSGQFPLTGCPSTTGGCSAAAAASCMRCNIAWQWAATAGVPGANGVYIDASNNNFPSYDINGSLKEQTIYAISQDPATGIVQVSYSDPAGGDMDSTWDTNSCGPKPGLQNDTQIYTFTETGTYLQIKEGKLYNPEDGTVVRSVNQKDNVDLVQRMFQLSNNTGRFCGPNGPYAHVANDPVANPDPNPVEVCIAPGSSNNCFVGNTNNAQNIAQTCFDENDNMLFIRSRLQDRNGRFWITDATGQLGFK